MKNGARGMTFGQKEVKARGGGPRGGKDGNQASDGAPSDKTGRDATASACTMAARMARDE